MKHRKSVCMHQRTVPVALAIVFLLGFALPALAQTPEVLYKGKDFSITLRDLPDYDAEQGEYYEPRFYEFNDGLLPVCKWVSSIQGIRAGYIDKTGKLVIPLQYADAWDFSEGLAPVENAAGKYGYIDAKNNVVIPHQYEDARPFSEGLARVVTGGSVKYINKKGKTVFTCKYTTAWDGDFHDGLAIVEKWSKNTAKYGFINTKGKLAISIKYQDAREFSDGLAAVQVNGKWGYINAEGKTVLKPQFKYAGPFKDGLAPVSKDGKKWGYINKKGKFVIPAKYGRAYEFCDGLAFVKKAGDNEGASLGIIDTTGTLLVPYILGPAESFSGGLAVARNYISYADLQDGQSHTYLLLEKVKN